MSTKNKKGKKIKKNDIKKIHKEKNNQENINNTPTISDSSLFDDINFSELFNPNDKFINTGEKSSYDLSSYNLGIFNSLSTICKNLNISYDKIFNKNFISSDKLDLKKENCNNENIINDSNNKENIFTDSVIKMLLSEEKSGKIEKDKIKYNNKEGITLNENDLDELLKDYFPMKIEKNDL